MSRGRFITLEGGEGCGKSTQAGLLSQALAARGIASVLTREPGGTPNAEAIRNLVLSTEGPGWNSRAEALLFAAARCDHVERLIAPALERGEWVICDRFLDSSRAYQGGGGGLCDAELLELHRIGSGGVLPDRTILIDVPPEEAAIRIASRDGADADRIGGREPEYHARVASAFDRIAQAEPGRFTRVDGGGSRDATHAQIMTALSTLLQSAR